MLRALMRIDAHQHFWRYHPREHAWMSDAMGQLKRDFLPQDLYPLLQSIGFQGSIAVQARQSLEETRWLLELAEEHAFIHGVVGWVDLCSADLSAQLELFAAHPKLVGVRHIVQDEPDDGFLLRPNFMAGIAQLKQWDLADDLLLYPRHLRTAVALVERFPGQRFVLDHLAKPKIAEGILSPWREDLRELAALSQPLLQTLRHGDGGEMGKWKPAGFRPYLDTVVEAFTAERLMVGSDWPVCLLSAPYGSAMQIVLGYIQQFSQAEQEALLGETVLAFTASARRRSKP